MFGKATSENGEGRRDARAVFRTGWMLVALAGLAGFAPQAADARSASMQLRVSATVLPRCQELNAGTGIRGSSIRICAPGSATLVRQAEELSVRSAPGIAPRVIRQTDPANRVEVVTVAF